MEELTVKKQLKRSAPIAFENIINILMTLTDTLMASLLGNTAITALGAMSVILSLMQMSIQTLHVSNNTLLARAFGNKDEEKIKLLTGNTIMIAITISMILIAIVVLIRPILPSLFAVDAICLTYLTIRLLGFIQNAVVTILSGHQRILGNQTKILKLRIFAVILNFILDAIALCLGYGIPGIAMSTILVDTTLMLYLVFVSRKTIKIKAHKSSIQDIFSLFKWNFIERIASKVDNFVFNIIVSRMGTIEYAVHVILQQIADIYETFTQGIGDGITISIGIGIGEGKKESINRVKEIAHKVVKYCSYLFPIILFGIAMLIKQIAIVEPEEQVIFYMVLPILLLGSYITMSATYYFSILRGLKEFKFLANRNIISSIFKIILAVLLGFTPLGITGVWIAYLAYGITQKVLSKRKYAQL